MDNLKKRSSIRKKIVYIIVKISVPSFFVMIGILFFFFFILERNIGLVIENDIKFIDKIYSDLINKLESTSKIISITPQIVRGTEIGNRNMIIDTISVFYEELKIPYVAVHDSQGFSLGKAHKKNEIVKDDSMEPYINKNKVKITSVDIIEGMLAIYSSNQIFSQNSKNKITGFCTVAYKIDNNFVKLLKNKADIEIVIIYKNKIITSTLKCITQNNYEEIFKNKIENKLYFSRLNGKLFAYKKIEKFSNKIKKNDLEIFVLDDVTKIYNSFYFIAFMSILILIICIITGLINAIFTSKNIVESIYQLLESSKKVSSGNYNIMIDLKTDDEIAELAENFNYMTKKIKEYNNNLEKIIEEKTKKLKETHEKLIVNEKIASIARLAGGIAHELNSPLSATLTSIQMLKNDINHLEDNIIKKDMMEDIILAENGIKKATGIVSKLLKYSYESKNPENVKINDEIINIIEKRKSEIESIEYILNLNCEIEVYGNRQEISEGISYIIKNSEEALLKTQKDKKIIKISTIKSENNKYISIYDNGLGINSKDINKIIEPFFTTKDIGKGEGLGLSIANEIFKKINAYIEISSEEGEWTEVKIYFN